MTPLVSAPQVDLLDALRGTAALRPHVDHGLAGGLRAWLEDGVFERLGVVEPGSVRVTTGSVAPRGTGAGTTALLRGVLVAQLLALHVAGLDVSAPFEAATTAFRGSGRNTDLLAPLDDLEADERSRLAAEVDAHHAVLVTSLPALRSRWSPRCGVHLAVPLAGGGVVCRGTVDLALGAPGGTRACVCLLDVTTARLGPTTDVALAYLALLDTLRAGEPPLRVAALSTADGATVVHDVTPELLAGAVATLLDALVTPA